MSAHQLARTTDPISSHLAAREHVESGRNESQKAEVLAALRCWRTSPTSAELALFGDMNRYMVARRLPDLERDGFVVKDEQKKCTVSGRLAVTWRLA